MGIMNVKKEAIIILLMVGILAVVSGCARWPDGPGPGPGAVYQLQITVQVLGEINVNDGIYYIVMDNNGNSADGPGGEVDDWEDEYYYVQLDDWGFDFTQVEEGSSSIALTNSSISDDELQVTISLSDLGEIEDSIDFNVVTTDLDNNTYDYLDSYLTIGTTFGSMVEDYPSWSGTENYEEDFIIFKVIAQIITL